MPLHVHLGGSSPYRRFSLLGIAQPIVGKYFQVLEVHQEMKHIQDLNCEKSQIMALLGFCKILGRKPSVW